MCYKIQVNIQTKIHNVNFNLFLQVIETVVYVFDSFKVENAFENI